MQLTPPTQSEERIYDFASPVNLEALPSDDPFLFELVSTSAFKRLQNVRFLGGQDYLFVRNPNGTKPRYTRFQHSLGVLRLALFYADMQELDLASRRLVAATALLHDIGHAPLSHSLESIFREHFNIDHHLATEMIITGDSPFGLEIHSILQGYRISPDEVLSLLTGNDSRFCGFFSGPINFDTIEGILRSHRYANPAAITTSPESVVRAALQREYSADQETVDDFWYRKAQTYKILINSRSGVLADYACQAHMTSNLKKISRRDFFATEDQLFRKLPHLRRLLISPNFERTVITQMTEPLNYRARFFEIDGTQSFFERNDKKRYIQHKENKVISP